MQDKLRLYAFLQHEIALFQAPQIPFDLSIQIAKANINYIACSKVNDNEQVHESFG
jgi:hypothetical protein